MWSLTGPPECAPRFVCIADASLRGAAVSHHAQCPEQRETPAALLRYTGMLHHISLGTTDLARARAFYDPVMETLGMQRTLDVDEAVGYGAGITVFSLNLPADGEPAAPGNGVHAAFEVEKRSAVDAFYRTALANGGTGDGEPGLRPEYDAHYYAAFVRDPDGNKIEALTFVAE